MRKETKRGLEFLVKYYTIKHSKSLGYIRSSSLLRGGQYVRQLTQYQRLTGPCRGEGDPPRYLVRYKAR